MDSFDDGHWGEKNNFYVKVTIIMKIDPRKKYSHSCHIHMLGFKVHQNVYDNAGKTVWTQLLFKNPPPILFR